MPVSAANLAIAASPLPKPATPTTCTLPAKSRCTAATSAALARHLGHHAAQNHSTTGLPAQSRRVKGLAVDGRGGEFQIFRYRHRLR